MVVRAIGTDQHDSADNDGSKGSGYRSTERGQMIALIGLIRSPYEMFLSRPDFEGALQ